MVAKILFVDDRWQEEGWADSLRDHLPETFELIFEHRGDKVLPQLKMHPSIKLVLLDMHFDGQTKQGEEILKEIKEHYPGLPVIILTSRNDVPLALQLVVKEKTAYYYFFKGRIDYDQFFKTIENAVGHYELKVDAIRKTDRGYILGESPAIIEVLQMIERAAGRDRPVLITGETGTGKELAASAIHLNSRRREGPYVIVNCGALPESLIENVLFGHFKEAFSGANQVTKGRFEEANGGTIFLDEIGELPLDAQTKLLRAVLYGTVDKVGSGPPLNVDVRIIAATNRNLEYMVKNGTFREDLYYRLNVLPIHMPPLRERREDIPLLVKHFVRRLNAKNELMQEVSEEAIKFLRNYHWPGNFNELGNILERAMAYTNTAVLSRADFQRWIVPEEKEVVPMEEVVLRRWGQKVFTGEVGWAKVKREFAASGEIRGKLIDWIIGEWIRQNADRPSGNELAKLLQVNRNYVNQIMNSVGRQLKDYGG